MSQYPPDRDDPTEPEGRSARTVQRRPQRRFRRPLLIAGIALGVVVAVVLAVGVGAYVYVRQKFDEIKSVHVASLESHAPGSAFNVLIVGSDSRANLPASQINSFGSSTTVQGQRSDVIMILHVDPATHRAALLSIPRDTFVPIAGTGSSNRINVAFNAGPDQLVRSIEQDFRIPINHYILVNFSGFQGLVNALGGVYLDFPYPAKDAWSGLNIKHTGCQRLMGFQALAVSRSRHYWYYDPKSPDANAQGWVYDGLSDLSRIKRQDAFLRALMRRASAEGLTNPLAANAFISQAVHDVVKDDGLSLGDVVEIARDFRGFGSGQLKQYTLPTYPVNNYGAYGDVLFPVPTLDHKVIVQLLAGGPGGHRAAPGASTVSRSSVHVVVLNGAGTAGLAARAASSLRAAGFVVTGTGNASSFGYASSVVEYPAGGLAKAEALRAVLTPGATLQQVSAVPGGGNVALVLGSSFAAISAGGHVAQATTTAAPQPTPAEQAAQQLQQEENSESFNPTPC